MANDFDNLAQDLENLENNLITVINDLKASTEIILKELTGYLNVSAHDLSEIRITIVKVESVLDSLKNYIIKLDSIEKEIYSIKPLIGASEIKIIGEMTKSADASNANMRKVAQYIGGLAKQIQTKEIENDKKMLRIEEQVKNVAISFKNTKDELIKNQEGLYTIINSLVTNKSDVQKAQISLEGSKIKTDAEKQKNTLWFWAKIIGIFFSTGGILFFILKSIVESLL